MLVSENHRFSFSVVLLLMFLEVNKNIYRIVIHCEVFHIRKFFGSVCCVGAL